MHDASSLRLHKVYIPVLLPRVPKMLTLVVVRFRDLVNQGLALNVSSLMVVAGALCRKHTSTKTTRKLSLIHTCSRRQIRGCASTEC